MASQLSKQSVETLIDLVEIKLGMMEVMDREDRRAVKSLESCLDELAAIAGHKRMRPSLPTPESIAVAAH